MARFIYHPMQEWRTLLYFTWNIFYVFISDTPSAPCHHCHMDSASCLTIWRSLRHWHNIFSHLTEPIRHLLPECNTSVHHCVHHCVSWRSSLIPWWQLITVDRHTLPRDYRNLLRTFRPIVRRSVLKINRDLLLLFTCGRSILEINIPQRTFSRSHENNLMFEITNDI